MAIQKSFYAICKYLGGGTAFATLAFATMAPGAHAAGILTQGAGPAISPVASSVTAALAAEQQGALVAEQAQNQLARVTTALTAMQNLQTAARNIALAAPSTVPDGLQSGGLVPDAAIPFTNADAPTQTTTSGTTTVNINQTAAQALLSWNSFNVSKNTTVNFNQQGNTTWVALNRVVGNTAPSQILGSIKASGQVYVINQNGIIFGGASQINVGALIASSADINDSQFTANGIYSTDAGGIYSPSFTNAGGAITVQPGAEITTATPATVTSGGGYVLLMGTQVQNAGAITTPDGQTELAAGDSFIIRPGYSTTSNATSTTRGNEIAVVLNQTGSGLVENTGIITADTGDITLAGETVIQNGVAFSTTSVTNRGTIHLLTPASDADSSVTLGSNATTLIEPDLTSTATELDSQRAALIADSTIANEGRRAAANPQFDNLSLLDDQQEDSRIEIVSGGKVQLANGSDSSAPGGQIAVSAADRVQADNGALLDVSGSTGVDLAMSTNDVAVSIQNNELRDDPQNRLTQDLRSTTVYVDARTLRVVPASAADANLREYTGGGLLEVSGYVANVGHTIGEYTTIGGSIALSTGSTGAIVAQTGSVFNLDGGTLQYQAGELQQSYLLGSDGRIYNVNNAPSDITYTGIYDGFTVDHPSYSISQTYGDVLKAPSEIFEAGYTEGRAAGSLTLTSPTTIFNGSINAATVNGPTQTTADPTSVTDPYLLTQAEVAEPGSLYIQVESADSIAAVASNVIFGETKAKAKIKGETLIAAKTLDNANLGTIQVVTNGKVTVAAPLSVAPGGTVNLFGSRVDIAANITAAGGSVAAGQAAIVTGTQLTALNPANPTAATLLLTRPNGSTGDTTVADNVTISTAGLWTNLTLDPGITFTQAFINGGTVNLSSVNKLKLGKSSLVDTSAGGVISITGAFKGGAGGNITLAAGTPGPNTLNPKAKLILRGTLDALGYTKDGSLTLAAPAFLITDQPTPKLGNAVVKLHSAFFAQGFSAYNLLSKGDITVADGTVVNVQEPTYQTTAADQTIATGAPAASAYQVALDPLYVPNSTYTATTQRPGASFSAKIVAPDGTSTATSAVSTSTLDIGTNAAIDVDPGQSIALEAQGQITIDGRLNAPGGTISAVSDFNSNTALANGPGTVSVFLGPNAVLNASAQAVSFENPKGERISAAPAGGSITLGTNASTASIIIHAGATLDASGTAATDQAATTELLAAVETPVEGAGGAISLASDEGIYNDGKLTAASGGADAAGGSLAITLEADFVPNSAGKAEATPRIFTITQADPGAQLPASLAPGQSTGLTIGSAAISADQITQGGFGSVTLFTRDAFSFAGDVTLSTPQSITLDEGVYTDTQPNGSVTLNAPYVTLAGQSGDTYTNAAIPDAVISGFSAQPANGEFTVNAAVIDLDDGLRFGGVLPADGTVAAADLAGFGTIDLNSSGDIQFTPFNSFGGSGSELNDIITTANVNLTAREIYAIGAAGSQTNGVGTSTAATVIAGYDPSPAVPATDGNYNPNGVLNIAFTPGTEPSAPDTLLGSLTFEAATINQGGAILQPLGTIILGNVAKGSGDPNTAVNFLPGSITSVSAARLNIPFGGTTDGVTYDVDGLAVASSTDVTFGLQTVANGVGTGTITIRAQNTNIETGAAMDLQGGGTLTGAGFISGEGGSIDVLSAPLLQTSASGVTQPTTNAVYAIIAGAQPTEAIAYTQSGETAATPALGQQIVIPAGVPGLAAGTYTLLPAYYALEPGGYRVELDGVAALNAATVTALPNGSYAVAGYAALADTAVRNTLASNLTITPGAAVLTYSQYDQESYSAFLQATATTFGASRPELPIDGGTLVLNVPISSDVSLSNTGAVSFGAANGGIGGTLQISGANISGAEPDLDIYGAAPATGLAANTVSLSASQIDAFDPFILELGIAGAGTQANVNSITLENGATLTASRVVLTALAGGITLDGGAAINTIGQATLLADSTTEGPLSNRGAAVLDVGNGYLVYGTGTVSKTNYGPITVDAGAQIYTDGSIAFSTSDAVNIDSGASYGGKYLDLAVPEINIGDPQALGAAAPPGLSLTPAVLQTLTHGIPAANVPAVQILNLTAFDSLNFYGTAALDLTGSNVELEINSPAIYGFGGPDDAATIGASTIVWNGIATTASDGTSLISSLPGGTASNGPGSGIGTLNLDAQTILLGYSSLDVPLHDVPLNRLTAGFATVNVNASTEITANNQGTLAVYQSVPNYNQAGTGGTLNLNTPLLTAGNGATIGYTAGGAINAGPATGVGVAGLASETAGGEVDLTGQTIAITGSVILPGGKLDLTAAGNITLGTASRVSLAGTVTKNVNATVYGAGGNLVMASATGNITQDAGSVIDVSAVNNAGSIDITATNPESGQVALAGTLLGASTGILPTTAGVFEISAQGLGDFAALNASLDTGGFDQTRDFAIGQGNLTIGNGVQAHNVSVSLDNGSLTVNGLIDASGNGGGTISLAAIGDLTLAATAELDAHGTVLQTDSYGAPVAAENAPVINLTSGTGMLTLVGGATLDLASADAVARGDLELNAPRIGASAPSATDSQMITDPLDGQLITGALGPDNAQSNDVAISAVGPLTITGAATIALNGFATYKNAPTDPSDANGQIIDQAYLDLINTDSQAFENNALANPALTARIAGLTAYASAFHLRPGVDITSLTPNGNLSVNGDIDLAADRYGPAASADGAGQPGVLQIRAGGNLNIYGSITDGFAPPASDAGTEFANGWVVYAAEPYGQNQTLPIAIGIQTGSSFAANSTVNFAVAIQAGTFQADAVVPPQTVLTVADQVTTAIAFVATSAINLPDGTVIASGQAVPAGTIIPVGATIAAGGALPFAINVGPLTWPANTPFTVTSATANGNEAVVSGDVTLLAGSFIPGGSHLIFQRTDPGVAHVNSGDIAFVVIRGSADGTQGQLYGLASLLPAGDLSWSIDLVAGANTAAANPNVTQAASALATTGNITLADTHYGVKGRNVVPAYSVIRTGTGTLSLVSGGSIDEDSSFGIYTAGNQTPAITGIAGNYPDNGGNVLVSAQRDLNSLIYDGAANTVSAFNTADLTDSDALGGWLSLQGGAGAPAAWSIDYGALTLSGRVTQYTGFQGMGTLGGGNLTVDAGGNAKGLDLVVASDGRITPSGALVQDGGGALNATIGGVVNFVQPGNPAVGSDDSGGVISDLRGDTNISAGSIGTILPKYGSATAGDPRFISPLDYEETSADGGIDLAPGDSRVTVETRGDLVINAADDPGTVQNYVSTDSDPVINGVATTGSGVTDFSLWTASTSIALRSAGGDVAPESGGDGGSQNDTGQDFYPATLSAISQNGNIDFGTRSVELMPSSAGELDLLAADSILGNNSLVSISGAPLSAVATPFDPGIIATNAKGSPLYTNHSPLSTAEPIDFGADTPAGALHAADPVPALIYAATGDILDIEFGSLSASTPTEPQLVRAAKVFDIYAGRDIIDSGSIASPDIFLNLGIGDITNVTAGRDIIESSFDIAGPGQLVVQAGRDYDAFGQGVIDSIGPIFDIDPNNRNSGADVSLLAGVGTGPDYDHFANQFLSPDSTLALSDASSILGVDNAALLAALQRAFHYTGTQANAYAYFLTLPSGTQDGFLRELYFALLDESGLEFNDPDSPHPKSYILGKTAIAALFPATYAGGITMYGASGVHTDFGGDIETLTPGGATTIGVEGTTPPASAGIITQGSGNIDIYALDSVELGESRVLTTFGGNIVIWSAQGDINAGRGSKTTIDFTPLQRLYDIYGDVSLSPSVPSSGAGIATLNPIPSVPAGNIDLVAPVGTVDAGEAGIRGSGNLNIAALHVLNAANINVQGATTSSSTVAGPNLGALSSASNVAGAAAQTAEGDTTKSHAAPLPSIWIVEILGYGDGSQSNQPVKKKPLPKI